MYLTSRIYSPLPSPLGTPTQYIGSSGWARTSDPRINSPLLLPTELRWNKVLNDYCTVSFVKGQDPIVGILSLGFL